MTYYLFYIVIASCQSKEVQINEDVVVAKTPVTVASISNAPTEEFVELNAISSFLQKWVVRANATGYLQAANVQLNKYVNKGQALYIVKTKEAQSIGNSINILDKSFPE